MDPNTALQNLREDIARFEEQVAIEPQSLGEQIIDQFKDLDEWLSKGGFLPEAWRAFSPEEASPEPPIPPGSLCWYGRDAEGNSDGTVEHRILCDQFAPGTITDVRTGRVIGHTKEG